MLSSGKFLVDLDYRGSSFQTITVINADLDLEIDPFCERDYLEILDGHEIHSAGNEHCK